jgi:hypothetical protein
MPKAHIAALIPQFVPDIAASIKRGFQMNLIDDSHHLKDKLTDCNRTVVQTRLGKLQYLTLSGQRQFMLPVDHLFALGYTPERDCQKIVLLCQLPDLGVKLLGLVPVSTFLSL